MSLYPPDEKEARLLVADNGPGIDPADGKMVLEPFYSSKPKGSGLGLATCRTMLESLGGAIEVAQRGEGGAAFIVRIPLHDKADSTTPGDAA